MTQSYQVEAVCTKGLPDGAKCVRYEFRQIGLNMPDLVLWFEHESFDPVLTIDDTPWFMPEYTTPGWEDR